MTDARELWRDVSDLGPFFAVSADPAERVDDSWRPLGELFTDPAPLADRAARVGDALGGPPRVAASITHQGLAARLVSAPLALAAVHGVSAPWSPEVVHWRPGVSSPWPPLWVSDPRVDSRVGAAGAGELVERVVSLLEELAGAVRHRWSVPARTLWGNAASSVVSAGRTVAVARPEAAGRAWTLVAAVLATGPLSGTGDLGPDRGFRRRSCCLYYRVPGGGLCGDCVLAGQPRGRRHGR